VEPVRFFMHEPGAPDNYNGSLSISFNHDTTFERYFALYLAAATIPKHYAKEPTNYVYTSLTFSFSGMCASGTHCRGTATVELPSLNYQAVVFHSALNCEITNALSGMLTTNVLADWLINPRASITPEEEKAVGVIFGYIDDASRGVLPALDYEIRKLQYTNLLMNVSILHRSEQEGMGTE
jgi:hypothetical protein